MPKGKWNKKKLGRFVVSAFSPEDNYLNTCSAYGSGTRKKRPVLQDGYTGLMDRQSHQPLPLKTLGATTTSECQRMHGALHQANLPPEYPKSTEHTTEHDKFEKMLSLFSFLSVQDHFYALVLLLVLEKRQSLNNLSSICEVKVERAFAFLVIGCLLIPTLRCL
eukprot:5072232-Amphidinium_carterae.1